MNRRGTVIIVVAGIAALLAALGLAFVGRMRVDVEETAEVEREVQARIMLVAACTYVLEAGRIGYDVPGTPDHEEAFGWIDVRDATAGPKLVDDGVADDSRWPIGSAQRFALHVQRKPPCAVRQDVTYNPLRTQWTSDPLPPGDAQYGRPLFANPDPQPAIGNGWPSAVSDTNFADYLRGDPSPKARTVGRAWFRLYRDEAARFVVTCGAGATHGWRDWAELDAAGHAADFQNDRVLFEALRVAEHRRWYRIEWSPAVTPPLATAQSWMHAEESNADNYIWRPYNASRNGDSHGQSQFRAPMGTIRWVQCLREAPTRW